MRREEWLDREIRTMVQGVHQVLGVGTADDTPVSPLTISGDPPPDGEDATDPAPPLVNADAAEAAAAPAPIAPPEPGAGRRRAARRKHKREHR